MLQNSESQSQEFAYLKDPHPDLLISFVLPVNDGTAGVISLIADILHQSALQTPQELQQVELLVISNNICHDAIDRAPAYMHNQDLLQIIAYIQGGEIPQCVLTYDQVAIIQEARRRNLAIHAIDHSSQAFAPMQKDITRERLFASEIAYKRALQTKAGEQLLLWTLDDDIHLNHHDVFWALHEFSDSDIDVLDPLISYIPGEGNLRLYQSHHLFVLQRALVCTDVLILKHMADYWKIMRMRAFHQRERFYDDAPSWLNNITAMTGNKHIVSTHVRMQTNDRARPFDKGGVLGATRLQGLASPTEQLDIMSMLIRLNIFGQYLCRAFPHSAPEIRNLFTNAPHTINAFIQTFYTAFTVGLSPDERAILSRIHRKTIRQEQMKHNVFQTFGEELSTLLIQGKLPENNPKAMRFLAINPWIQPLVAETRMQTSSDDEALYQLKSLLPHFFNNFEDSYCTDFATITAVNRFLVYAMRNPQQCPNIQALLRV